MIDDSWLPAADQGETCHCGSTGHVACGDLNPGPSETETERRLPVFQAAGSPDWIAV